MTARERALALADAARGGDRRALARLLTAVENHTDVAEHALRLPVRIGVPHHVAALADLVASPIHAAAIGLLLAGGNGGKPVRLHAGRADGLLGRVRHRMGEWLRDFF
jgi:cell division protein FtsA